MIQTPTMTAIAWVARGTSVAMALATVWALGRTAREVAGKRAGVLVSAVSALDVALVYYAHATNLEVPYLFWGALALLFLVRAVVREEPRRLRRFAVLAALAIGSKDQAAGLFLLGAPAVLGLWMRASDPPRRRAVLREALVALGIAVAVFLVADEVVVNPTGFAARVRFLLGPASQDHGEYAPGWPGTAALVVDLGRHLALGFPWLLVPFTVVGLIAAVSGRSSADRGRRPAALAPLLFAASFAVCINLTAKRTEHRFVLPELLAAGFYGGIGMDRVARWAKGSARIAAWGLIGLTLTWSLLDAASVDAALLHDPRYDAEACLRERAQPGDTVEVYGNNVYLPRIPAGLVATRVGPDPVVGRSPRPDLHEVSDAFDGLARRDPRWIVLPYAWAAKYIEDAAPPATDGRRAPPAQHVPEGDPGRPFFRALVAGRAGYRVACYATYDGGLWPRVDIHASTGMPVWVFERR